ncbi:MAG: hypothetical protein AAGD13_00735 [Pseudomonadota bacterium]
MRNLLTIGDRRLAFFAAGGFVLLVGLVVLFGGDVVQVWIETVAAAVLGDG